MRRFGRFACLDWSGQAVARPKGIAMAVCFADDDAPQLFAPAGGWSREGVLAWAGAMAAAEADLLIGIDFSPALPFADRGHYLDAGADGPHDARALWAYVDMVCADEPHLSAGSFAEHGRAAPHFRRQRGRETIRGAAFEGSEGRLRVTERACRAQKLGHAVSCYNLIGPAQVGKASLTGMRLLHRLTGRVPIWPFDPVPARGPLIVEIYTGIAARAAGVRGGSKLRDPAALDAALATLGARPHAPLPRYDDHSTDALLGAAWLRRAATDEALWHPPELNDRIAATEGWTFGVR